MAICPPLMTHADRQRLIQAPFPTTRVLPRRIWAGVHIPDEDADPTRAYGGGSYATQWTATLAEALVTPDPTDALEDL